MDRGPTEVYITYRSNLPDYKVSPYTVENSTEKLFCHPDKKNFQAQTWTTFLFSSTPHRGQFQKHASLMW